MSDVTRLLAAIQLGDSRAGEALLPLVYAELRKLARAKMAREPSGHTLQPTALVHEAWLRLGGGAASGQQFENREHFFGAAAEAMRRILVERARRKLAIRNGAGAECLDVDDVEIAAPTKKDDEILAVHEALDALATHDLRKATLVKLRYFAGMSIEETAEVLGISAPTAKRDWTYARAWLFRHIADRDR